MITGPVCKAAVWMMLSTGPWNVGGEWATKEECREAVIAGLYRAPPGLRGQWSCIRVEFVCLQTNPEALELR